MGEDRRLDAVDDLQRLAVGRQEADPGTGVGLLARDVENEVRDFVAVEDVIQEPAGESSLPDDRAYFLEIQAQNSFGTSWTLNLLVRSAEPLRTPHDRSLKLS